jgi:hypothetical protein
MTRNEAAERLRGKVHYSITHAIPVYDAEPLLDQALAAERDAAIREHAAEDEIAVAAAFQAGERHGSRATVERIRAEVRRSAVPGAHATAVKPFRDYVLGILDEEAAR